MKRSALTVNPDKVRDWQQRSRHRAASTAKRRPISPASPEQRRAVADRPCIVTDGNCAGPIDPAHVIARGMLSEGQDDARAVIALCRHHHMLFDRGALDLLPFMEPVAGREELSFAVWRFGLLSTLERVTNQRWVPVEERAA